LSFEHLKENGGFGTLSFGSGLSVLTTKKDRVMNITEIKSRSAAVNPLAIIDRLIAELELTPTQYGDATKSYEAVAAVLQKINPQLSPRIFPQGSMRLGTTVRPIQEDRFDLDIVCWLAVSGKHHTPDQVFNVVWDALGQNEVYRQMRSKMKRCIRLEYAPERKFYLDVTPAVPDWAQTDSLYVPDREHKKWCSSHPIGFCDEWFKKAADVLPTIRRPLLKRADLSESVVMANAAYVEPMPEFGEFDKTPLQRIVQMLKRDRDEYFQDDAAHRPSSILLTTITTQSYSSLVSQPVGDLLEFVVKVVEKLPEFILAAGVPGSRKFYVMNPVNAQENFAENWSEEHYKRFRAWHGREAAALQKLQQSKGRGADVMLKSLSENFGSERVIRAARSLGADTSALHESGQLRVAGGTVGAVGAAIPKTIYFGSAK
jgi:hypothetical protein